MHFPSLSWQVTKELNWENHYLCVASVVLELLFKLALIWFSASSRDKRIVCVWIKKPLGFITSEGPYLGGMRNFFKSILMLFIGVHNVFLIINFDVTDILVHIWISCEIVRVLKSIFVARFRKTSRQDWQILAFFKVLVRNFLYKNLC